jgi:peptidoglycan hydrolase-like protein with peptidoglycan-binding domain
MPVERISNATQPSRSSNTLHDGYRAAPSVSAAKQGDSIHKGQEGASVKTVQRQLNAAGAHPPLAEDGMFGPKTDRAVRQFQQQHGLAVDGLVGPKTLKALQGGGSVEGEVTRRNRTTATAATGNGTGTSAPQDPPRSNRTVNTARGLSDNATPAPDQPAATAAEQPAATQREFAPEKGRATGKFSSDKSTRLDQAEQIMRANGQWPPKEGRSYAIQIDQDEPKAGSSYDTRNGYLRSYTGQMAVFKGHNGGLVEEMAPGKSASHPGQMTSSTSPDVSGDGSGDVAHLHAGVYNYQTSTTWHNGKERFNPAGWANEPVARDINHNGVIDGARERKSYAGSGIQIHPGNSSSPSSTGCQTMAPDVFKRFHDAVSDSRGGQFTYILVRRPNDHSGANPF